MSQPYPPRQPQTNELNEDVGLAPADAFDPVIEAYKKDVDRTILRENLKLSPQERSEKFVAFMKSVYQLREIAARERNG
jgi:hypothetical protein